jgi:N-acetyl-anhydromuramyl-L-alanine amidase AmpD
MTRVDEILQDAARLDWRYALHDGYDETESPNYFPRRRGLEVRCVVWHIAEGSYESALTWLTSPLSQVSSNDLIRRDGFVMNLVKGVDAPWTNGLVWEANEEMQVVAETVLDRLNPNLVSYTIECAGHSTKGGSGALTERQTAALIIRTAQACMAHRLTADRSHILRHSDWDSVTRSNCPGYSPDEMSNWVERVRRLTRAWRGW